MFCDVSMCFLHQSQHAELALTSAAGKMQNVIIFPSLENSLTSRLLAALPQKTENSNVAINKHMPLQFLAALVAGQNLESVCSHASAQYSCKNRNN